MNTEIRENVRILHQPANRIHLANTVEIPNPGKSIPANLALTKCEEVIWNWTYADMLALDSYAHVSTCKICFPNEEG